MAKKIVGFIKLQVPAGKANPSPPIGPALGQRGLNIMEFCKSFNAQTQGMEPGLPIPVVITAYADKSFTFIMKTPPASVLIKKAAGVQKGSMRPHTDKVGKLTRAQAEEIAKAKQPDLTAADLHGAIKGVRVQDGVIGIRSPQLLTVSAHQPETVKGFASFPLRMFSEDGDGGSDHYEDAFFFDIAAEIFPLIRQCLRQITRFHRLPWRHEDQVIFLKIDGAIRGVDSIHAV